MNWSHIGVLLACCCCLLSAAAAQQQQSQCLQDAALKNARKAICPDSRFTIHQMKLTGRYHKPTRRHVFFKGSSVKLCMNGTATNINRPVKHLQVSVFGTVKLLGVLGVNHAFCDLNTDGCSGFSPPCAPGGPAVSPGQNFCMCTTITIPRQVPIDLDDVTATLKLLGSDAPIGRQCEESFDNNDVRAKNKQVLACAEIPVRIRDRPRNGK